MSTRCNVQVFQSGIGWDERVQLYHHCDGYPSNMLPLFAKAFKLYGKGYEAGRAGKVASFLCALEPGKFEPESGLDMHGDIDYFYEIDARNSAGGSMAEKPSWFVTIYTTKDGFWDSPDAQHLEILSPPINVLDAEKDEELLSK